MQYSLLSKRVQASKKKSQSRISLNSFVNSLPTHSAAKKLGYQFDKPSYLNLANYFQLYHQVNPEDDVLSSQSNRPNFATNNEKQSQDFPLIGNHMWLHRLKESVLQSATPTSPIQPVESPFYDSELIKNKQLDKEIEELRQITALKKENEKKARKPLEPTYTHFPTLTPEMLSLIKSTLAPGVGTVVKAFAVDLQKHDIHTLLPGTWLNDEIINFYGELIMKRSKEDTTGQLPNVHYFSTFFWPTWKDTEYTRIKRWTKKFDLFSKDVVIIPIHLGMHWCCSVINFRDKKFEYYDSLLGSNPAVFRMLRTYLKKEHLEKKKSELDLSEWVDYCPKNIPAQGNGFDCGVFTCIFAEYRSRLSEFDFSQVNMPYYRKRIVWEILNLKLLVQLEE